MLNKKKNIYIIILSRISWLDPIPFRTSEDCHVLLVALRSGRCAQQSCFVESFASEKSHKEGGFLVDKSMKTLEVASYLLCKASIHFNMHNERKTGRKPPNDIQQQSSS